MSLRPVAAARSDTLIGPAALMAISKVSLVGSPRTANVFAWACTASGGLMAAIAWHTRSPSMTR